MDVFIYQAALYCTDCGESIRERLDAAGETPDDPSDESSYDSDDYPKGPFPDGGGEADSPQHCGAGEDCLNALTLAGTKVGAFLENQLTSEGVDYAREMISNEHSSYQSALHYEWIAHYRLHGLDLRPTPDEE